MNVPDRSELTKRVFKYLIQFIAVAVAAKFVPACELKTSEILMIGVVGAVTFAVLDMYAPTVSQGAPGGEQGAIGVKNL